MNAVSRGLTRVSSPKRLPCSMDARIKSGHDGRGRGTQRLRAKGTTFPPSFAGLTRESTSQCLIFSEDSQIKSGNDGREMERA